MAKLIGDQQEQDEDEFWAEHADYFQSSDEDEEFEDDDLSGTPPTPRASPLPRNPQTHPRPWPADAEKNDSEDSDIDQDENEVDSDAEAAEAEKAVKRQARSGGRKGVYQDPALRRRRAATTMPRQKRAAVEIDPGQSIAMRKTKRQATGAADERRAERKKAEALKKKPVRKVVVPERKLTAQEMFQEAARTEVINKAALERLLELEEEKRKDTIRKRVIGGPRIKYSSRTVQRNPEQPNTRKGVNTITFTGVDGITISKPKPDNSGFGSKRRPTVCHITKKPAKYVDPLTELPYHDLAAFKAIRAKLRKGEIKLAQGKVAPPGALPKAQPAAAAAAAAGGAAAEKAKPAEIKKEKK